MTLKIVCLDGHLIRRPSGTIILVIYSKLLCSKILKIKQKVSIIKYRNGLIIKPNGGLHATIASGKRIQIAITKLYKNILLKFSTIIPLYVNLNEWGMKKIVERATGFIPPISLDLKKFVIKPAAIKKTKKHFYIDISFKKLSDLADKEVLRCLLSRDDAYFVMIKSDDLHARKLTKHSKRRIQIALPQNLLASEEVAILEKKKWFPILLKFDISSFGLDICDFYTVTEEGELVKNLVKKGIIITPKNYKDPYDIYLNDYSSCIEIHNSIPSTTDLNLRHGIRSGQVCLRVLEGQYLINKLNLKHAFIIINNSWRENKHIMDLINDMDKRVHVLFTNFNKNWSEEISDKISDILNIKKV